MSEGKMSAVDEFLREQEIKKIEMGTEIGWGEKILRAGLLIFFLVAIIAAIAAGAIMSAAAVMITVIVIIPFYWLQRAFTKRRRNQ